LFRTIASAVLCAWLATPAQAQLLRICTAPPPSSKDNPTLAKADSKGIGLTFDESRKWGDRRVLGVRFLNGDEYVRGMVWRFARTWERYAAVDLVLTDRADAEIRVAFQWNNDKTSWSKVGTDALDVPKSQPTMNFGWFDSKTKEEEFRRTTLHEFGHALGFKHEHQNPKASIPWDKEAVYKYFKDTNGWDKKKVDHNLFAQLSKTTTNSTAFDPKSIMLYEIPESLTVGNFSTKSNSSLSEKDKEFAAKMYPWSPRSIVSIRNTTDRTATFQYKWTGDSDWRDVTIEPRDQRFFFRSPSVAVGSGSIKVLGTSVKTPKVETKFPSFEVKAQGKTATLAANRLDPTRWKGRNYPAFEDGKKYRCKFDGGTLRLVSDD
jgi:hypothetical protein